MTQYELSGTSRTDIATSGNLFQYYRNGILKLSDEGESLLSYLPTSWHMGTFVRNLQETLGMEFERAAAAYQDVQDQMFIETATWGLQWWEQMLGLPIRSDVSTASLLARRTACYLALGRSGQSAESYFLAGLKTIAGPDVLVTLMDPVTNPYTVAVEVPINYYEDDPDVTGTTATVQVSGSISSGDYSYRATFKFSGGETTATGDIIASTVVGPKDILLESIPLGPDGTLGRKIYRSKASTSHYSIKLLGTAYTGFSTGDLVAADVDLAGAADTVALSGDLDSSGDEIVYVMVDGTSGHWKLTYDGQDTANLDFNATAGDVVTALETLSNIEVGDVEVSLSAWGLTHTINNNSDTVYLDSTNTYTGSLIPLDNTAKTALAQQVEKFVADTKPAHIHVDIASSGFLAGIDGAGEEI